MEWFNAVAGLVEHLVWPLVLLTIVWWFRKPLQQRVAALLSVETPAGKITFGEQVEKVAELTFEGQQRAFQAELERTAKYVNPEAVADATSGLDRCPGSSEQVAESNTDTEADGRLPSISSDLAEAVKDWSKLMHPSRRALINRRRLSVTTELGTYRAAIDNPSPTAARQVWETLHGGAGSRWLRKFDAKRLVEIANDMVREGWLAASDAELIHVLDKLIDEPFRHGSTAPTYIWSQDESRQIIRSSIYLARVLDDIRTPQDDDILRGM